MIKRTALLFGLILPAVISCVNPFSQNPAGNKPDPFVPDVQDEGGTYVVDGGLVIDKTDPDSAFVADCIANSNRVVFLDGEAAARAVQTSSVPGGILKGNILTGAGTILRHVRTDICYMYENDMYVPGRSQEEVKASVRAAFAEWAACSPLTFTEVQFPGTFLYPTITVSTGDLSSRGAAGITYFRYNDLGSITSARIVMDNSSGWSSLTRFKDTMMHEIGHALGLAHEHERADATGPITGPASGSSYWKYEIDSIMNYNRPRNAVLTEGDRAVIQYIYMRDNHYFQQLAGDYNGDGREDILRIVDQYTLNELFLSDPAGGFTRAALFNIKDTWLGHSNQSFGSMGADFDGDGDTDILRWCNDYTCNALYLSDGDGSFTYSTAFNVRDTWIAHNNRTFGSLIGDFNGDGAADILRYCDNYSCNALYLSNRDGSFTMANNFNIADTWLSHTNGSVGSFTGDFNGDGATDVLRWFNDYTCNVLYLSNRDGSFTASPNFNVANTWINHSNQTFGSMIGDFNGDGADDILRWCNDYACNALYLSNRDGSFTHSTAFNVGNTWIAHNNRTFGSLIGDFNGDGADDILRYCDSYTCNALYLSNKDGSFTDSSAFNIRDTWLIHTNGSVGSFTGDFNGDGAMDIVTRWWPSQENPLRLSNGNGTFRSDRMYNVIM